MTIQLEDTSKWPVAIEKPFIIAGPCSAESEDQMLKIGHALKSHRLTI